jgi:hypothetical protein
MKEDDLNRIVGRFDQDDEFDRSEAFSDGGTDSLFPRLHRAALNQMDDGNATVSRYGIWANTVRDNIIEAERLTRKGQTERARKHLVRAANSLSAFSEIQALCDEANRE